jgi:methylmalonyl-CoA mutase
MPSHIDDLPLAREFPPATRDDWKKLVDGVLKGAPFEKLVSRSYDGLRIEPVYPRSTTAQVTGGRAAATPWRIMQRIDHPDTVAANTQALEDLENGATALALVFAGAPGAHGFGLPATAAALAGVVDGIHPDAGIGLEIQAGAHTPDMAAHLARILADRSIAPASVDVRFAIDPIGIAAAGGGSAVAWPDLAKTLGRAATDCMKLGFTGPLAMADGRIIHDAGGSEAQELAYVLATAVATLRAFEAAGIDLDQARRLIYVRLSADADQFLTLTKFRVLRQLWSRVEESCGLAPRPLCVTADSAWRMLTARDPYVNLLRATIATFAAGLGGANSITVLPHSLALGLPDPFARRLARNTQLVLLEESNLDKVTDPAAGAGGIESLTTDLARAAWSLFQQIEAAGGAFPALQQDLIQGQVGAVREARAKNIARRKDVLTGVSEFPNLHELPLAVLEATRAGPSAVKDAAVSFTALAPIRLAAAFEGLRDRSDAMLTARGARPKVFLANLGSHADFTARATFAKSLFEAGGIEAIDGDGGLDPAAIAAQFKASGAALACLCSSDKIYPGAAATTAPALRSSGAKRVYLAGRPGDLEASLRAAGIDEFVHVGIDAVATLTAAYGSV